jgi:hypothetical protein
MNPTVVIIGAGPIGLLTACCLHVCRRSIGCNNIKVYEKRIEPTRFHSLSIDMKSIQTLLNVLDCSSFELISLISVFDSWKSRVDTNVIQESLMKIALSYGIEVIYEEFTNVIPDVSLVIGADGARSKVRELICKEELFSDEKVVSHMCQMKFKTYGSTKPRSLLGKLGASSINAVSGSDLVITFENMSGKTTQEVKSGTLNIPVSEDLYNLLLNSSEENKGTYANPWTLDELEAYANLFAVNLNSLSSSSFDGSFSLHKLVRLLKRYVYSLESLRGGKLISPKITVLPLKIYRSSTSYKKIGNTNVVLVGDASSGCIYETGFNKGIVEVSLLLKCLMNNDLESYDDSVTELYNRMSSIAQSKNSAIESGNVVASSFVMSALIALLIGIILLITRRQL